MNLRRLRSLRRLLPTLLLAIPNIAAAQDVSSAEHEAAVTNFQAGRRFVEQNDCKSAIPRFVESLRHEQNVGARFNLAECSEKEKKTVDAWNQYKGAEQLAIQKNDRERADLAHTKAAALEQSVLKVRLVLPERMDFTAKIDGVTVEKPDHSLLATGYAVEPNHAHTIQVTSNNRNPWSKSGVQGPAGAELPALVVDLGPPLTPEGADAANIGSSQRTAGLVVGGVGIAGLALGSVFGILASGAKSDAKKACESGPSFTYPGTCDPTSRDTVDKSNSNAKSNATISTIGFIAGGALLAGGAVLYLTAPSAKSSTSAARLRLAPAVSPGTAGAVLGGAF